ncbi:CoA-transferase family III domain-containing protein [Neohortaea acidophila]|uniref:CoA-transferase family III domain-containing protein n=1 Tax=Neohortaea acidophila TaxID=245834 RepID=A0A6A6PSY3_9PEZI|nr:CoA-transferase family III domain-containing protein [Neohortaea acidophila]KAF2482794.1 CoA-transferase family III domain-containing protein [Neohortaea acidophila]
MGSIGEAYSVQREAQKVFEQGVLQNPLIPKLPAEIKDAAKAVHFTGSPAPIVPINWRFAESASVLKAFEASLLNVLRLRKYGAMFSDVTINTNHASLFTMSLQLAKVVEANGELTGIPLTNPKALQACGFKNQDLHDVNGAIQRHLATNIYKTRDGKFYHVHGSMNPDPTLQALGLSLYGEKGDTRDTVVDRIQKVVEQHDSAELDRLINDQYKQAGTIAYTVEEFRNSEHGKANAHVGLYELSRHEGSQQPASWWPEQPSMPSSASRPLAGLKVVDLTRVIAAPTITRSLAEMGASVMRVTSPNVTDHWGLHADLNWGKWNCYLDLKKNPEDRAKLAELIKEADVVVEGYRPEAMARNGFGRDDIFELVKGRDRGIIHVRENCYGWYGPWAGRSGWQQISDACTGVSLSYGKAIGSNDAVTPGFPNSDYSTGISGSIATLHALIRRGEEGGSFSVDVSLVTRSIQTQRQLTRAQCALNYYKQWLINSVGTYPPEVWSELWKRHGSPTYRHYQDISQVMPDTMARLRKEDGEEIFDPTFFERRQSKAMGREFVHVKPIVQFKDDVRLGFHVGCRSNGLDQPRWPEDLGVEVVE